MQYIEQLCQHNLIGVAINRVVGDCFSHYKCGSCKKFVATRVIRDYFRRRNEAYQTHAPLPKAKINCQHCGSVLLNDLVV